MTFGEKLRKLRKEKGLTQAQLAKLAGLGLMLVGIVLLLTALFVYNAAHK